MPEPPATPFTPNVAGGAAGGDVARREQAVQSAGARHPREGQKADTVQEHRMKQKILRRLHADVAKAIEDVHALSMDCAGPAHSASRHIACMYAS